MDDTTTATHTGTSGEVRTARRDAGRFVDASAVTHLGGARWRARVAEGWEMAGVPNGGYLMAIAARAAIEAAGGEPIAVTAHYHRPARTGPLDLRVEPLDVRERSRTTLVTLSQVDRTIAHVLVGAGELPEAGEARTWGDAAPPRIAGPDDSVHPTPDVPGPFRPPELTRRVELRLEPRHVGFAVGQPDGDPTVAGWARLADGSPPDPLALLLIADAFPPAIFNSGLPLGWVPTLHLHVQVRRRPAPGWLAGRFTTRVLDGERIEEDGELWDADGHLVASSRQLALAPRQAAT